VHHLSKIELAQALRRVEELGQIGEEFVNSHFEGLKSEGKVSNFQWESQDNAVSPYDFWYERDGRKFLLDVKATSGGFERSIHISLPELQVMRDSAEPYYVYRVYEVEDGMAKLRISGEMRPIAEAILKILLSLPEGVGSDGVSVSPLILGCGAQIALAMPDPVET